MPNEAKPLPNALFQILKDMVLPNRLGTSSPSVLDHVHYKKNIKA